MFTPQGVGITRLSTLGVWRCLRNVDEVNCPRSFFYFTQQQINYIKYYKIMKKFLLLAVCFIMMGISASALTINKAMLVHNGNVTLYDGDKIQDAVNASSDGDVIYLTLGTFKPFNITKRITVRGVGETSIIDGNVDISISGSPKLTSPVMEALAVSGTVTVKSQVDDMIIRKCKITNFGISAQVDGAVLDRCYITNALTLSSYIKGMTVVNSKLYTVQANSGATQNTTFVNCNIYGLNCRYFSATVINSILYCYYNYNTIESTVLLNTLISTYSGYSLYVGSSSVNQNGYSGSYTMSNSCDCSPSSSYVGTDGTIVGIYGGETPYTLEPTVPKVTNSNLQLDMENKKLNVNLTVSPQ